MYPVTTLQNAYMYRYTEAIRNLGSRHRARIRVVPEILKCTSPCLASRFPSAWKSYYQRASRASQVGQTPSKYLLRPWLFAPTANCTPISPMEMTVRSTCTSVLLLQIYSYCLQPFHMIKANTLHDVDLQAFPLLCFLWLYGSYIHIGLQALILSCTNANMVAGLHSHGRTMVLFQRFLPLSHQYAVITLNFLHY